MNNSSYIKILGIAAIAAAMLVGTARANPITGALQFNGDVTASVSGGTTTVTFGTQRVYAGTGDYSVIPSVANALNFANFVSMAGSLSYTGNALSAVLTTPESLWGVDGWSFDLLSISTAVLSPGGLGLTIQGDGIAYGPGSFSPTVAVWSIQGSTDTGYTFALTSDTTAAHGVPIPDGGTTALLLGAGLVGVGLIARRRKTA